MRLLFCFAVLCSSVTSALSLPSDLSRFESHGSNDILTAVGASSRDEVSLVFEAPCHGCFVGVDNGLVFTVAIRSATRPCGPGYIHVNGQEIEWSDTTAEGDGVLPTPLASGLGTRQVNATWEASCLADLIQVLSFTVHNVGQDMVKLDSGFTISFNQAGQPEVFRLVGRPIDVSIVNDLADQWMHPARSLILTTAPKVADVENPRLEDEVLQLAALQTQSHELHFTIEKKKHKIFHLLKDDFRVFYSAIKKCDSFRCMFETTMHKLPEYAHIIALHFTHYPHPPQVAVSFETDSLDEEIQKPGHLEELSGEHEPSFHGTGFTASEAHHDGTYPSLPIDQDVESAKKTEHEHTTHSPIPSQTRHISPTATPIQNGTTLSAPDLSSTSKPLPPQPMHHPSLHYYLFILIIPPLLLFLVLGSTIFLFIRHVKRRCASARNQASRASYREERLTRRAYRRAAREHAWRHWWSRYRRPTCTHDYEEKRTLILAQEVVLEDAMQQQIHELGNEREVAAEMRLAEEGRARLYREANLPPEQQRYQPDAAAQFIPSPRYSSRENNSASPSSSSSSSSSSSTSTSSPAPPRFATSSDSSSTTAYSPQQRSQSPSSSIRSSDLLPPPPSYDQELEGDMDVVDGFQYSPIFGAGAGGDVSAAAAAAAVSTLPLFHPRRQAFTYDYSDRYVEIEVDDDDEDSSTPDSSVVDCSPRMSFDTGRSTVTISTVMEGGEKRGD